MSDYTVICRRMGWAKTVCNILSSCPGGLSSPLILSILWRTFICDWTVVINLEEPVIFHMFITIYYFTFSYVAENTATSSVHLYTLKVSKRLLLTNATNKVSTLVDKIIMLAVSAFFTASIYFSVKCIVLADCKSLDTKSTAEYQQSKIYVLCFV